MRTTIPIGLMLLVLSHAALAWQPVVYPIRSQNAWQQNADAATCYAMASSQTKVNITREAQAPTAPKPASGAAGKDAYSQTSQPPLPASGAASAALPASATGTAALPASAMRSASAAPASGAMAQTDKNGMPAMPEASGASGASATTEADAKTPALPPPPPPEPPMTRYWRAYGVCMQGRGYAVQ